MIEYTNHSLNCGCGCKHEFNADIFKKENNIPDDLNIDKEYKRIKEKKSKFSANTRKAIIYLYEHLQKI